MAQSTRKEPTRQLATELEQALPEDRQPIVREAETLLDPPGPYDSLDLGHARLHSACWGSVGQNVRRCRRPLRKRMPLHLARRPAPAEARFTSSHGEFIECG